MPAPPPPRHTANINDLLNDTDVPPPQLLLDEKHLNDFHTMIVRKSSGCSLEQLEQVNAALMDTVWKHRAEWNRNVVLHNAMDAFNTIIVDIEEMQKILKFSQEEDDDVDGDTSIINTRYGLTAADDKRQSARFSDKHNNNPPYTALPWQDADQGTQFPASQPPPTQSQFDSQIATQYGGGGGGASSRQPQSGYL